MNFLFCMRYPLYRRPTAHTSSSLNLRKSSERFATRHRRWNILNLTRFGSRFFSATSGGMQQDDELIAAIRAGRGGFRHAAVMPDAMLIGRKFEAVIVETRNGWFAHCARPKAVTR